MNLIEQIADYIYSGLSHAETAVKLEVEHGVQVTEAWLMRITGADSFIQAMDAAILKGAEKAHLINAQKQAAVQAEAAAQMEAAAKLAGQPIEPPAAS